MFTGSFRILSSESMPTAYCKKKLFVLSQSVKKLEVFGGHLLIEDDIHIGRQPPYDERNFFFM